MINSIFTSTALPLIACSIRGSSSSLPSALVQLDLASTSAAKNTPRSLSANFAASLGGAEFTEWNSAKAALDGNVTFFVTTAHLEFCEHYPEVPYIHASAHVDLLACRKYMYVYLRQESTCIGLPETISSAVLFSFSPTSSDWDWTLVEM